MTTGPAAPIEEVPHKIVGITPNQAQELVSDLVPNIAKQASQALTQAQATIQAVNNADLDLDLGALDLPGFDDTLADLTLPEAPGKPSIDIGIPGISAYTGEGVETVDPTEIDDFVGDVPQITASFPKFQDPTDPGEPPTIDADPQIGPRPSFNLDPILKRMDALIGSDIPQVDSLPHIDFPAWEADRPTFDLDPPGSIFKWSEDPYVSELSDKIKASLLSVIANGGTGLSAEFEAALWQRTQDRQQDEYERERAAAVERFAGMGWELPGGAMESALRQVDAKHSRYLAQINHEMTIEQARLAQNNWQFAHAQGIALENVIADVWNRARDRALAAARAAAEDLERIFQMKLAAANFEIERYKTDAQVYEARMRGAIARIEAYRAKLEGQKTAIELKSVYADLLKSQLGAYELAVSVYRADIEAARAKIDMAMSRLTAFREKVNIYVAKWQGVEAKIGAYQAELAGDKTRADIFSARVQAYDSYVRGKESQNRVKLGNEEMKIKAREADIAGQRLNLEQFQTVSNVNIAKANAEAQVYSAETQAYSARVQAESIKADAKAKVVQAKSNHNLAISGLKQKDAEVKIQAALQSYGIEVEKLKSIAAVSSQLAASIFSALNVGASMSDSYGESYGVSYQHSESLQNSKSISQYHNYQEK